MYQIIKQPFGFRIVFSGFIKEEEMQKWYAEAEQILQKQPKNFGVFVDMREMNALPKESVPVMETGQKLFREKGMTRSAVVLSNPIVALQFEQVAKISGIYEWERYIATTKNPDWENASMQWIEKGLDPDQN